MMYYLNFQYRQTLSLQTLRHSASKLDHSLDQLLSHLYYL